MQKDPILKTKRLTVTPMTADALRNLIAATAAEDMRLAYGQMLEGSMAHPAQYLWYTAWEICEKSSGTAVGHACFMGEPQNGAVEIGYGMDAAYTGRGYMTEALQALTDWAFSAENVYAVEAETAPDNTASQRVLEKLHFVAAGNGVEGPRFALEKPASSWTSICMCLGLSLGMCIGSASDNMSIGMCCGMAIGVGIGASLDAADKKQREKLKAQRQAEEDKKNAGN